MSQAARPRCFWTCSKYLAPKKGEKINVYDYNFEAEVLKKRIAELEVQLRLLKSRLEELKPRLERRQDDRTEESAACPLPAP